MKLKKINYKVMLIILSILIIIVLSISVVNSIIGDKNNNNYGERLIDVNSNKMNDEEVNALKELLLKDDRIKSFKYNLEGRIINIVLECIPTFNKDMAMETSNIVKDKLTDKQKGYFDIQIFFKSNDDTADTILPIISYKNKNSDVFKMNNTK